MSTTSADWTENQSVTFNDATPAKTVEARGSIDLAGNGYIGVSIQAEIGFGASADGNATIAVYSSPDSGTTVDTIPLFSQEVSYAASTTKRLTIQVMHVPYVVVGVKNGNTAIEDIAVAAKYAALEYVSA